MKQWDFVNLFYNLLTLIRLKIYVIVYAEWPLWLFNLPAFCHLEIDLMRKAYVILLGHRSKDKRNTCI